MPNLTATAYCDKVLAGVRNSDGVLLGKCFAAGYDRGVAENYSRDLYRGLPEAEREQSNYNSSYASIYARKLNAVRSPWLELAVLHTDIVIALNNTAPDPLDLRPFQFSSQRRIDGDTITAYTKQHELVNTFYRWMLSASTSTEWVLPVLYTVTRDLKRIATLADIQMTNRQEKAKKLEEASRMIQKCFAACLNDRSGDAGSSRKMGVYYMATLLFKIYFKLKSTALCININKGIKANELVDLAYYPLSHQISYRYYMGVFAFLREDYGAAETELTFCLQSIRKKSQRQIELILDRLIPILMLRGVLPSQDLLASFPRLKALYTPFVEAFRTGDVALYDEQLAKGEKRLMERGTYLVVEKVREGAVRALMKKAWVMEGKPAKLHINRFQWYFKHGAAMDIDAEEVECLIANMIASNLIKGYISHSHQVVVLSKDRPFPWYGPHRAHTATTKQLRDEQEVAERKKPGLIQPA